MMTGLVADCIGKNLDFLIVGINPGFNSARCGHHYGGPGNHFWPNMYASGLISEPFTWENDYLLPNYGIGLTNLCDRTTRSSSNLTKAEMQDGARLLQTKIAQFCPKVVVFNGKGIFETYSGKKVLSWGLQIDSIEDIDLKIRSDQPLYFVMPSSSPRCASFPTAKHKLPFYVALKLLKDYINLLYKQKANANLSLDDIKFEIGCRTKGIQRKRKIS